MVYFSKKKYLFVFRNNIIIGTKKKWQERECIDIYNFFNTFVEKNKILQMFLILFI